MTNEQVTDSMISEVKIIKGAKVDIFDVDKFAKIANLPNSIYSDTNCKPSYDFKTYSVPKNKKR